MKTLEQPAKVSEFECTFDEYKQQAAEFFNRLKSNPAPTPKQIESGLHCLRLAYIYMTGSELERYQCEILLGIADKKADEILRLK